MTSDGSNDAFARGGSGPGDPGSGAPKSAYTTPAAMSAYEASSANVHRNGTPAPAGPDLTPARAPTVPTNASPTTVPTIVPTVVPAIVPSPAWSAPGRGAGKTQTYADTCGRQGRTTPADATSAPSHSRTAPATTPTGSTPAGTNHARASSAKGHVCASPAEACTAEAASNKAAVDAAALKAATAEPGSRGGVGRNQSRRQSCDDQCTYCFPQHEDLPSLKGRLRETCQARFGFGAGSSPRWHSGLLPTPAKGIAP